MRLQETSLKSIKHTDPKRLNGIVCAFVCIYILFNTDCVS